MTEYRQISLYVKEIQSKYYINTKGEVFQVLKTRYVSKRVEGKKIEKCIIGIVDNELKLMKERGLSYTKVTIKGFEHYLILLQDGTLLKRLKPFVIESKGGYYFMGLQCISDTTKGGKKYAIHRLMANVFFTNKEEVIHHINHNKLNNDLSNLLPMTNVDHTTYHNSTQEKAQDILNKWVQRLSEASEYL